MEYKWIEKDILLVDKPEDITSFDVIRQLRRELGIKKMGHAGTLDPLATGLMIVGVNSGTKKMNQYLKLPKTYIATVLIGEKSTTGDAEGEIVERKEVKNISETKIDDEVKGFIGVFDLPVPIYSAIKQGGEALYKKARRGEKVDAPNKSMEIIASKLLSVKQRQKKGLLKIEWRVSSGTYIRTLAEELGRRLGYPARLDSLRRISIGDFSVEDIQK